MCRFEIHDYDGERVNGETNLFSAFGSNGLLEKEREKVLLSFKVHVVLLMRMTLLYL